MPVKFFNMLIRNLFTRRQSQTEKPTNETEREELKAETTAEEDAQVPEDTGMEEEPAPTPADDTAAQEEKTDPLQIPVDAQCQEYLDTITLEEERVLADRALETLTCMLGKESLELGGLQLVMQALDYEKAVSCAYQEGLKDGRREKVTEILDAPSLQTDGVPLLKGSRVTAGPGDQSIFDLARFA